MEYTPKTALYVGTDANSNGILSDHNKFMGGNVKAWGHTFDPYDAEQDPDNFVEVFAGVDVGNNRIVSPDLNFRGATQSIGFLSLKALVPGMFKVYVGRGPDTNGEGTPNEGHQGEITEFVGYALP